MAAAFDPYHKWLGIPADLQPPNCYRLLGIRDFEDDLEVVQAAADQRTTHLRSYQNGPHADLAAQLLSEVQQARKRLLDADDKTEYDAQLREQQKPAKPTRSVSEGPPQKLRSWPDGKAPSSVEEFHQCLDASRVMSADDSRRFLTSLPAAKRPDTAKNLAIELLKAGKLTRHQAESVLKGKIKYLSFGEYIILEKLGQGGMGQVLKAEHRRMRRTVALKVISGPMMKDAATVRRFQREVHAAARLIHPNIVTAFDANEHEGVHFFVMEYVEGRDLAELVNDEGPLPVAQAVDYVLQAARGLAYAHGKGIVHRDIKPANLLLDEEGTVKILDMGLARMDISADDGQELTNTGQVMGTVDYMAPEQAEDTHAVDGRADVYSLGCTLYRLLAGQVLYSADTVVKKLLAHRSKPIPTLGSVCQGVPASLEATFQKMVAKRPEDRQPTMAHVVSELESCLRGSSPSGSLPRSTESTIDFPLSDLLNTQARSASEGSDRSPVGKPSSAAVAARAEKTQSAGTEVTQDFTKGDTGISIGAAFGNAAPSTAASTTPTATGPSIVAPKAVGRRSLRSLVPPYARWIAAAFTSLALLAAGIVIFLPTADGTIRVEINDPSIEVTVAATGYTIKGKTEEIHIQPGEHTLQVKAGDLKFDTTKFTLGKGENPAVKVQLLPEKVQVVGAGGKVLGEKSRVAAVGTAETKPAEAPDRLAAEALHPHALLTLALASGRRVEIKPEQALPPEPYTVQAIGIVSGHPNRAADFVAAVLVPSVVGLSELTELKASLGGLVFTEQNIAAIAAAPCAANLRTLDLAGMRLTPATMTDLKRFSKLSELRAGVAKADDDTLAEIRNVGPLSYLRLESFANPKPIAPKVAAAIAAHPLKSLIIDGAEIGPELAQAIGRMPALIIFEHYRAKFPPQSLQDVLKASQLAILRLQSSDITDDSLDPISESKFLRLLDVRNSAVTESGVKKLSLRLPNCEILWNGGSIKPTSTASVPPAATAGLPSSPSSTALAPANSALEFNGQDTCVDIPTLKYDGSHPLTIEATIVPYHRQSAETAFGASKGGAGLRLNIPAGLAPKGSASLFVGDNQQQPYVNLSSGEPLAPRRKYEVAGVIDGPQAYLFIDGKLVDRKALPGGYEPWPDSFVIGANSPATATPLGSPFAGIIDELRFSRVARYTAAYTPVQRFEPDANTLALYHFDEGQGDELKDSSGNGHHGKIVGAKWVNANEPSANSPSAKKN